MVYYKVQFVCVVTIKEVINPIKDILGNMKKIILSKYYMCRAILNHVGIKNIYYTNQKGEIVKY